jgi:hypothetical protein
MLVELPSHTPKINEAANGNPISHGDVFLRCGNAITLLLFSKKFAVGSRLQWALLLG